MRTIIFISLCLCLVVATISAEKSSHKHGDNKKLLKSGHEQHQLQESAALNPKSALPLKEDLPAEHKPTGRKHHRSGKNKKGGHHAAEQQTGRSRKPHSKSKANNNGPTKSHHNKHGRKGRGKQQTQQ